MNFNHDQWFLAALSEARGRYMPGDPGTAAMQAWRTKPQHWRLEEAMRAPGWADAPGETSGRPAWDWRRRRKLPHLSPTDKALFEPWMPTPSYDNPIPSILLAGLILAVTFS